jgi:hypothetical protein
MGTLGAVPLETKHPKIINGAALFSTQQNTSESFCSFFQVAIDTAAPLENDSAAGGYIDPMDLYGAYGSMRSFGRFCGGLDYNVSTKQMHKWQVFFNHL